MRSFPLFAFFVAVLLGQVRAAALPPDPAARGLDVFVHAPSGATVGGQISVQLRAFGFATATRAAPLSGATIEAAWDPEKVGPADAPSVKATTDANGKASITVQMPPGDDGASLDLLVAVRHGTHARTRTISMARRARVSVELYSAEANAVPGSTVPAWVRVTHASNGRPVADANVDVSLREADIPRETAHLRTDRGGMAVTRLHVPLVDQPGFGWTIVGQSGDTKTSIPLGAREETPGTPSLTSVAAPPPGGAQPGDHVPVTLRLRDASGRPVARHPLRWWSGPGEPPKDEDKWREASKPLTTDIAGEATVTVDTPTVVKPTGLALHVVTRTDVEGRTLETKASISVARGSAAIEVSPEAGAVVPGIAQKVLLHVQGTRGEGVRGEFDVRADGLERTVSTDERGDAELDWNVPAGIGATRDVGPCAGGVAAAVRVAPRAMIPALGARSEGFTTCVSVDRDMDAIVRATPSVAHPGDTVHLEIASAKGARPRAYSVLAVANGHPQSTGAWVAEARGSVTVGDVTLPKDAASGRWTISAAPADATSGARVLAGSFIVTPHTIAKLELRRTGGRASPGGTIDVTAKLTDRTGKPLVGTVSGLLVDAHGGSHLSLHNIDALTTLCNALGTGRGPECDGMLDGKPELQPMLRAALATSRGASVSPEHDPGAHAKKDLDAAFSAVVKSLEGAVLESTASPDRLLDARRRTARGWELNPELLTLVTDAMSEPPTTPGGELLTLTDLVNIDPQVTFDNVARRVTRLKLFRVLAAVRDARREYDRDEPALRDPSALLRKLVRDGRITTSALLDPWGGTMQFVRVGGAPTPFIGVAHGFELRAPGPDGRIGTADDVRDPFERVLRSGTPYAQAVDEDRLVDARFDMRIADATVEAWSTLIEELTGTALGSGGLGLHGVGSGGGGYGSGSGHGRMGGSHVTRSSRAIVTGDAYWVAPTRTNAEGEVHLRVPLGDVETTWRLGLLGVPDGADPATATLDIASDLPISAKVDAGARWTVGDDGEARVTLRNRTPKDAQAKLTVSAEGACSLRGGASAAAPRAMSLPRGSAVETQVGVVARAEGTCTFTARVAAVGAAEDVLRHTWDVAPRGEPRVITSARWVEGSADLSTPLDAGYSLRGTPRLVLERGYAEPLAAALDSLEPERIAAPTSLLDVIEAAQRVRRWAVTQPSPRARSLAAIAEAMERRALGRYRALATTRKVGEEAGAPNDVDAARLIVLGHGPPKKALTCPEHGSGDPRLLDLEPPPGPNVPPCWGAMVTDTLAVLERSSSPVGIARGVLAAADRPHRMHNARLLTDHLRRTVRLRSNGEMSGTLDRADRALVYAALLRAGNMGTVTATPETLFAGLAKLRDALGGYGSPATTSAVVRALLSSQLAGHGASRVVVTTEGSAPRSVDVAEGAFVDVALPAHARAVHIETVGPGLVARLERPALRAFTHPPPPGASAVKVEAVWPSDAQAGKTGTLRLVLSQSRAGSETVDTRVPLPPGVSLASSGTRGVHQMQGRLLVRWSTPSTGTFVDIPVRFGLRGRFTAPEISARLADETSGVATGPAQTLVVR